MNDTLTALLETSEPERLATGFEFTEGPLWHPDGFFYFVDIRANRIYRLTPGQVPTVFRENTGGGNGTSFDLQGNLVVCEGGNRRVTKIDAGGNVTVLADNYQGKRLNAPNDVVCRSDGSIYFTDPTFRMPFSEREVESNGVYRVAPDGAISLVAEAELPNGLAFSPDERTLYVANTRATHYVLAFDVAPDGSLSRRRIFADMSSDEQGGAPDGMKVDAEGRVYCTGSGGTWVFTPEGKLEGIIRLPEIAANLAFGGPDFRTLFFTARTSVYSIRVRTPGQPHPWYRFAQRA
jgi:gluconolactonase